jgi:hypothetical protein
MTLGPGCWATRFLGDTSTAHTTFVADVVAPGAWAGGGPPMCSTPSVRGPCDGASPSRFPSERSMRPRVLWPHPKLHDAAWDSTIAWRRTATSFSPCSRSWRSRWGQRSQRSTKRRAVKSTVATVPRSRRRTGRAEDSVPRWIVPLRRSRSRHPAGPSRYGGTHGSVSTTPRPNRSGVDGAKWANGGWRNPANSAEHMSTLTCIPCVSWPPWHQRARTNRRPGSAGGSPAHGKPWGSGAVAMRRSHTGERTGQACDVQVPGEPRDTEMVQRGSQRGRWKRTYQGNSLAAYSTSRPVRRGLVSGNTHRLPGGEVQVRTS